jgi:hypothetical protein
MSSLRLIAGTLGATLLLGGVPAAAQPVEHPSQETEPPAQHAGPELGVEINVDAAELDASELRAAIALDLAVGVTDATGFAPALGRLEIAVANGAARISYRPAAGTLVERTIALPVDAAERIELLSYIATNLVRDQAGEVLAGLRPAQVVIPPPAPPPTPGPRPRTYEMAATIGFVPPLAVDRIVGSHVIVGAGLHALVGSTDGSRFVSISGLVDSQREFASGIQIGGIAAIAGRLDTGIQIGGIGAVSRGSATGLQIGGLTALAQRVDTGLQIGGLAAVSRGPTNGLQIGGLTAASSGDLEGMQIAGLVSVSRADATGLQIGGLGAVASGRMRGMQIAGGASVADSVRGVQISGGANIGGDVEGMQIGVINVAKRMRGVQIGVVNVTGDGDDAYPIGLINYAKNGRVAVDAWVESSQLSGVALRHGTRHIHNVWGVAYSPDHDHLLAGAGLGYHTDIASGITLDIDAMNWWTNVWNGETGQLNQLRATVALPVGPVDLFAGAAANVYISDDEDESQNFHPVWARNYMSDSGTRVVTWPTAFVGVRLRAR